MSDQDGKDVPQNDGEDGYDPEDSTNFVFNIRDENYFPTFEALPYDNDFDLHYYTDPSYTGIASPIIHWCLLAEIVEEISWIRPMFTVKDKAGKQFLLALHLDRDVQHPKIWEKHRKVGGVIAVMYAASHGFMDGQHGVRVESEPCIKFLPCSLSALLRIGDELDKEVKNVCGSCKKAASQQCSRCCRVKYCSKDCQTRDWKMRHKDECVAIQQVAKWKTKNWSKFNEFWMD